MCVYLCVLEKNCRGGKRGICMLYAAVTMCVLNMKIENRAVIMGDQYRAQRVITIISE